VKHLSDRVNTTDAGKGDRKDMVGIKPYVDIDATMALVNSVDDVKGIKEGLDFLKTDDDGKLLPPLHKRCQLDRQAKRRLKMIIAGSIRPPHRLVHAGISTSDVCMCVQCDRARCDTQHIFWKCARWKGIRTVYLAAIQDILNKLHSNTKYRAKQIEDMINSACFQHRGICPGDQRLLKLAYQIDVDDPGITAPTAN
jgi:hypothetical protein